MVAAVLAHGPLEVRPAADAAPDAAEAPDVTEAVVAEPVAPPRPAGSRPALRGGLEKTPLTYFSIIGPSYCPASAFTWSRSGPNRTPGQ